MKNKLIQLNVDAIHSGNYIYFNANDKDFKMKVPTVSHVLLTIELININDMDKTYAWKYFTKPNIFIDNYISIDYVDEK